MEKKPRLFVAGPTTEMVSCLCGGPDIEDMMTGLGNMLKAEVEDMSNQLNSGLDVVEGDIELSMRWMTDEEADSLPDIW